MKPGAVDKPDLNFQDTNCDGIDGDVNKAIFVSLAGNDAAPGTLTNPKRNILAAITAAGAANKDVYIAGGTYFESLPAVNNVGLYGGYEPVTGKRSASQETIIQGATAILAQGDVGVVLQQLTLRGIPDASGNSYAIRAIPSAITTGTPSKILLERVKAEANAGSTGAGGSTGSTGIAGFGFGGGGGGIGGLGNGILGALGGGGFGNGGLGGGVFPNLDAEGDNGGQGGIGSTVGSQGLINPSDSPTWNRSSASTGGQGSGGGGGGGGRGGVGATLLNALRGGTGGPGGTGGGGGFGGSGGQSGGGSFGAYLFNSTLTAVDSKLSGGAGGAGGNGGSGGFGAFGNGPGAATGGQCETSLRDGLRRRRRGRRLRWPRWPGWRRRWRRRRPERRRAPGRCRVGLRLQERQHRDPGGGCQPGRPPGQRRHLARRFRPACRQALDGERPRDLGWRLRRRHRA